MSATIDITLGQLYTVIGNFIQSIVGIDPATGLTVQVVTGQANRVSMPNNPFVLMQASESARLGTNEDSWNTTLQTQATKQKTRMKVQLDCYGPNSHTWATMLSTLFRDYYGCDFMKPTCQPLYVEPPFQGALVDGEEQYEERWTVLAYVQYNPVTTFAQQSATGLAVSVINVDARYKP
jgi:hypothetical protein